MDVTRQESALRHLRRTVLDAQRGTAPPAMLDCFAHMLLYFDEPQMMHQIGLQHLLDRFAATRVDLGFGSMSDRKFQACAVQRRSDCDVPDVLGMAWPNQDRAIQSVWQSRRAVYLDVGQDPVLQPARPVLKRLRTRVKLARRLEDGNRSFGIVCIDHTEERRCWSQDEQRYLDQFVVGFLSPIMAESRACGKTARHRLTAVECAVVRLAAEGLGYKEIAVELHKSPHTVDNQLRKIRARFGVHNKVELVRACSNFL